MRLISLESAFEKACKRHEHLKLLESQWRFDKELISKALQNINSIFPHYSRHDASHSRQIIVNIERMLGNRVKYLSATDIWLILEAAYSHDIGMVITHKQMQDVDSATFKSFIQDLADQPNNDLYDFANNWLGGTAVLPSGSAANGFFDKYRQILAEWYRKKHPENAAKIVNAPLEEIGLASPRNELLPKRLFGLLGAVCNAHGQPFDQVMELPFSEAGMAIEDCHPRYVAFLLRMGDLLDVDDNRFCPVMMRTVGATLPKHSHAHFEKHRSIKNFRLDSERIKIEVVCPNPESYEVAHDWFKWLEQEYHSQSQHWPKIVPNRKMGRLPTLSPPKVLLKAPYLVVNEGKKPSFHLNQESILKLLRGTGLYSSKMDSVREVLQNAVDSTIIAIWTKYKDEILPLDPTSPELLKIYDEYKIFVDFTKSPRDSNLFTLVVKDVGVGIGKLELENMLHVGSSNKSGSKSKMIRDMPQWFKPSGNFGIGLQSIYLLSKQFSILTKSRLTHEAFKISIDLEKAGAIVIEGVDPNSVDYGAIVAVDIKFDEFPQRISIPWGDDRGELVQKMNDYDFTRPGSDLKVYEQFKIFKAIEKFNDGSPIKIDSNQHALASERLNSFFSKKTNIVLSQIKFGNRDYNVQYLFRGQSFDDFNYPVPFVFGKVDFYGHQAMDFLTYNREKILPDAKVRAEEELKAALIEYIDFYFEEMSEEERPYAAAFYFLYGGQDGADEKYQGDLMRFEILFDNKDAPIRLSDIVDFINLGEISNLGTVEGRTLKPRPATSDGELNGWALLNNQCSRTTLDLIKLVGTKAGFYWQEQKNKIASYGPTCFWSKQDIFPVSAEILHEIMGGKYSNFEVGNRIIFPAWGSYRKLAVVFQIPWARLHSHTSFKSDYLVLPYKFGPIGYADPKEDEDLINWVMVHLKGENISRQEVEILYAALKQEIKQVLEGGDVGDLFEATPT